MSRSQSSKNVKGDSMKSPQMMILVGIGALVIGTGGGYMVGSKNYLNQSQTMASPFGAARGNRNFGGGPEGAINGQANRFAGMGRPVSGTVISLTDNTLKVQQPDGSSKLVILSDQTKITNATAAQQSDLKANTSVAVFGTANSDGSVTAQSIQLNPEFRGQPNMVTGTSKPTP